MNDLVTGQGSPGSHWLLKGMFRLLRILLLAVSGLYLVLVAALALFENSLVYPGSKYPKGNWEAEKLGYSEVEFKSTDGTKLFGWYLSYVPPGGVAAGKGNSNEPSNGGAGNSKSKSQARTILHCHGNAENIAQVGAYTARQFSQSLRANVFAFDYRGFGKSEGSPHEQGVLQDAEAALEWVCQKDNVKPNDVILVGHSLGGGPACFLAEKYGCRALILQRTFSSLPEVAAYHYPVFPVGWIMQNRMDSATAITSCPMPLFQSHGDQDTLIPIQLGKKIFDRSPAKKKKFFKVKGMGHLDPLPGNYWRALAAFIDSSIGRGP